MTGESRKRISPGLLASGFHPCAYLADRTARTVVVDPGFPINNRAYSELLRRGMRRSGSHIYSPACPSCRSCQSLRIPVDTFQPRRRQRRCWQHNADLTASMVTPGFSVEHFSLYRRYLLARHPGDGMDDHGPDDYLDFLVAPWSDTRFVEFRLHGTLLAVAVIDVVEDGFSAVYTFFDPEFTRRGLGTYAILWQIDAARRYALDHVYLGYWIAESEKMRYKADFSPCEVYRERSWQPLCRNTD